MGLVDRNDDGRVSPGEFGRAAAKVSWGLTTLRAARGRGGSFGGGPDDGSGVSCGCLVTGMVTAVVLVVVFSFACSA